MRQDSTSPGYSKRNIACFSFNTYPNTVRRKLFDLAEKIVGDGHSLKLKISKWKLKELNFQRIYQKKTYDLAYNLKKFQ